MPSLPTYETLDCPICAVRKKGHCMVCGKKIPSEQDTDYWVGETPLKYRNMGANGFQSISIDHYHFKTIEDVKGRRIVMGELCLECYREDFRTAYPEARLPM